MQRTEKEKIVEELTERLKGSETLIVADYRGLSVKEIDDLRTKLLEQGATFTVVKNSLTRRAAEAAGADALLALLDGPSAIAFLESEGDAVAVAKALADSARETRILTLRGGLMQGLGERLARRDGAATGRGDGDRGAAGDGDDQAGQDGQQTLGGDGAEKPHGEHDRTRF